MSEVRILQAGLEEDDGQIVIRGVLDKATLKFINMAWYQREQGFSDAHIAEIMSAFYAGGKLADITIGMRGTRVKSENETYRLLDKCYCIDGGQRVYAAGLAMKERPDIVIRLGVKVYTGTTEDSENEMFCKMNSTQVRIAPSVLMRNHKKTSAAAQLLLTLCKDPAFALKDRIAWGQRKSRHELLAGFSFAKIVGALHAHQVRGLKTNKVDALLAGLDAVIDKIGEENLHTNVVKFFDTLDLCWTLRNLAGGRNEPRPQLRQEFLSTIATLFSHYSEFWDGKPRAEFYCSDRYIKRLKSFPLNKYLVPHVSHKDVIYEVLRKHLNLRPLILGDNDVADDDDDHAHDHDHDSVHPLGSSS